MSCRDCHGNPGAPAYRFISWVCWRSECSQLVSTPHSPGNLAIFTAILLASSRYDHRRAVSMDQ
jgi:hypothetical protein